jgi:hypothetical protein
MIVLAITRFVLAVSFGVAAATKMRDGIDRAADTVARFWPVAERWYRPLAVLVIVSEGAAALLLATPFYRVGAATALALALGFAWVVSSALAAGRALVCGCFGTALPLRVGPQLLAADLALAAASFSVVLAPGIPPERHGLVLGVLVGGALAVGGAVQSVRVAFATSRETRTTARGPIGPLAVRDAGGELRFVSTLADRGVVLLWLRPGCPACLRVMQQARDASEADVEFVLANPDGLGRRQWSDIGFEPAVTIEGSNAVRVGLELRLRAFPSIVVLADQAVQVMPNNAAQDGVARAVAIVRQFRRVRAERSAALAAGSAHST